MELSGKFNWQCSLPWDRIQPKMRKSLFCFFFLQIQLSGQIDKAYAVQNVVKGPRTQYFHSGLFTVLSGAMMIDHLQFHQFHGKAKVWSIIPPSTKILPKPLQKKRPLPLFPITIIMKEIKASTIRRPFDPPS